MKYCPGTCNAFCSCDVCRVKDTPMVGFKAEDDTFLVCESCLLRAFEIVRQKSGEILCGEEFCEK